MKAKGWSLALCSAIVLLAGLAFAAPAQAATITVTTTADEYNSGADCSLREAITAARDDAAFGGCPAGNPGNDFIQLQGLTYGLSRAGANENDNVTGDLDIQGDLTINGPALPARATIDANDIDRVFDLRGGGSTGVEMRRLIIQDGTASQGGGIHGSGLTFIDGFIQNNTATGSGGGSDGTMATYIRSTIVDNTAPHAGGILSFGGLELIDSRVDSNDATDDNGQGGGIWSAIGNLTITDSAVTFNTNQGEGGGILASSFDPSAVTLTRTRVANNSADDGGGGILLRQGVGGDLDASITDSEITINFGDVDNNGGNGGGIANFGGVNLAVAGTTISGNRALDGGGVHNSGNVGLTNVTMSGNTSDDQGGGIFAAVGSNTILNSMTFDNNTAPAGGHIWKEGDITAVNTLMGDDGGGGHCLGVGQPMTVGTNMESNDLDDCGFTIVPDVLIGPLQNNGGPTLLGGAGAPRTHALLAGSPAIDAGSGGPPTDQRGVPRPQGQAPDLGAYERAFCQGVLVNRVGTEGDDSITGTTDVDGILALGGDDLVHGLEGDDHICGGAGNDDLWGGDPFTVGDGRDLLLGGGGNDTLRGGDAADDIQGAGGADLLLGGAGADDASGGSGADDVRGNAGNDDLFGNGGPDKLAGGPGNDDCNGGPGTDSSTGCETKTSIP